MFFNQTIKWRYSVLKYTHCFITFHTLIPPFLFLIALSCKDTRYHRYFKYSEVSAMVKVWKICLKNVDFATWFRLFSCTSNFDRFQFSSQFHCERAIYLLRKPWISSIEKLFWKWKHLWHGRSIQTLVKVLLFH